MDFVTRLTELLEDRHWSVNKLAMESGITQSTLYNIINNKISPNLKTIEDICQGLDINLSDFFDDSYEISPEEHALLSNYNNLDERDKVIVLNIVLGINNWK